MSSGVTPETPCGLAGAVSADAVSSAVQLPAPSFSSRAVRGASAAQTARPSSGSTDGGRAGALSTGVARIR